MYTYYTVHSLHMVCLIIGSLVCYMRLKSNAFAEREDSRIIVYLLRDSNECHQNIYIHVHDFGQCMRFWSSHWLAWVFVDPQYDKDQTLFLLLLFFKVLAHLSK